MQLPRESSHTSSREKLTFDSLAAVEHLLNVLAHDVVDVGQIVVQAVHVLGRVRVRVFFALFLDKLVYFDQQRKHVRRYTTE